MKSVDLLLPAIELAAVLLNAEYSGCVDACCAHVWEQIADRERGVGACDGLAD